MIATCPECNKSGKLNDELAGSKVHCPGCGSNFVAEATQLTKWYYADGDNKLGPISQDQFDSLVDAGTIVPDTLIWHKGMDGWQPLAEVQGAANMEECDGCHGSFAPGLLQDHDGVRICESCQHLLQRQNDDELTGTEPSLKYGSVIGRFIAKVIDLTFMLALAGMVEGLSRKLFPGAYATNDISPIVLATLVINVLLGVFYITWFVGKLGATPGKMVVKQKITNPAGAKISYAHAFGRYCGEYIGALGMMVCVATLIYWTISSLLPFDQILSSTAGAVLLILATVYAPALFDSQRRTLYDRLCNTRVLAA